MFEIIETFSQGKVKGSTYSEDRVVVAPGHFGILDGSRGPDYAGDDVITELLDRSVAFIQEMPAEVTLDDFINSVNGIALEIKEQAGLSDLRATGGFVFCLYSAHFNEIWRVGDCKFRLDGQTHDRFWSVEEVCSNVRALILEAWRLDGLSDEEIMAHPNYAGIIDPQLHYAAKFLNRSDRQSGMGAINGTTVHPDQIERFPVNSDQLIITSDGYPIVGDSLKECEEALEDLLARDPLCIGENLQSKGFGPDRVSFDDRSFIQASGLQGMHNG